MALLAAGAVFVDRGTDGARPPAALLAHVDGWLVAKGLGIDQVSLEGHRYTPDTDVLDALDLPHAGSMLLFNGTEAATRILRLPWIDRVQIKPLVPNGLHVVVTERRPYAVWEHDGRRQVIDQTGRVLGVAGPRAFADLPLVQGEGAPTMAADLHATLSLFPALATRLVAAERIGARRWILHLAGGMRVHLPASQEAAALQRLAAMQATRGLLDRELAEIDLRAPGMMVLPRQRSATADPLPGDAVPTAPRL